MSARSLVSRLIPPLAGHSHKGQQGRVGVVGGSFEYTGAPYYAGISSLKTGADLCHLFCVEEAAVPVKSYSPELIVHPLLRSDAALARCEESKRSEVLTEAVERIAQVLPRLDSLVIGPGLGRDASVQEIARKVIAKAREANLPLVLDGDALYLVSVDPDTVKGYRNAILTPNAMEYARLCATTRLVASIDVAQAAKIPPAQLSEALGFPVVIQKGGVDTFSDGKNTLKNDEFGCPRRCGGQGDVLTGAIGTFAAWTKNADLGDFDGNPLLLAAYGGSLVTRASSSLAFHEHQRSMTAPDVLHCVGKGFIKAFPNSSM
ncbi:YjeF family domain-containing protein [Phytophthora nicotianae P1976]|uniref:ATP-dependent (S)-NAD(P)H-hydrate dehydratase n=1 Tax=Phytophthora nicotianae P1976 TaxID=1317066 RepID=A0A080Z9W7_PHYNI|nr:YjeF family domain-containing protein [Phytophthora nicotianae P1976]